MLGNYAIIKSRKEWFAEQLAGQQDKSRAGRPSIQEDAGEKGEENDWEGAKSRPKARDIESTKKTDDRARHRRNKDWRDYQEQDEPENGSENLIEKEP